MKFGKIDIVIAVLYGIVVLVVGSMLQHTFAVTSPQAYFWFGTMSAWVAAAALFRRR